MEYKYPLTAINRDGKTIMLYSFENVRVFVKKNGWFGEKWTKSYFFYEYGKKHHPSIPYNAYRSFDPVHYNWIVRDDWGRKVNPIDFDFSDNSWRHRRMKNIRRAEALGLPIPNTGCSKAGWRMDHPAKKNSGKGKRNRDRALCEYERIEYGIKNSYGKVRPWEGS